MGLLSLVRGFGLEEIRLTNHGAKRLRERLGIPKRACQRAAQKAYDEGITFKNTAGEAHRFFDKIYHKNDSVNNTKVYGQFAYLFSNNVLITVLNIPKDIKFIDKSK